MNPLFQQPTKNLLYKRKSFVRIKKERVDTRSSYVISFLSRNVLHYPRHKPYLLLEHLPALDTSGW